MKTLPDLEDLAPTADLRPLQGDEGIGSTSGPEDHGDLPTTDMGRGSTWPGLVLVFVGVAVAFVVHNLVDALSPLVVAVLIGATASNLGIIPGWARRGVQFSAKRLLRFGVVLLGFQLALTDVLRLGAPGLGLVITVVGFTFFGTQWLGRRMGVSRSLSLLIATGFSICGASAVAAVEGVADAEEEEVALSIALVTLCGSLAIAILPVLGGLVGLEGSQFGAWVGASVHDIAQVVATASTAGTDSLHTAVIVKLTRIVLLAPMVAGVTIARRRADQNRALQGRATGQTVSVKRTPIMPLFVVGFLAAMAVRSVGLLPPAWIPGLKTAETLALAAALVGLGTGVHIGKLRKLGGRPLALGLASWILIATISYVGVRIVGPL
ncbi:MAG: YeiH family protein [Microthrixaceae bacterium]